MRRMTLVATAWALVSVASAASAQPVDPPDPATIRLPDLTPNGDPQALANGGRHFYFRKTGVSYAEAYDDFRECYRYFPVAGADPNLPMFAPWGQTPGVRRIQPSYNFGLVGVGIAALFPGPTERKRFQARLVRCLETRGYVRHPLSEPAWRQLIDDYSERSIALQAKAAALPAPGSEPATR